MLGFGAAGCGASNKASRTPEPKKAERRDTVVVEKAKQRDTVVVEKEIRHVMLMYGVPRRDFDRREAVEQPNGGSDGKER